MNQSKAAVKRRRKRGVILTATGLSRFQTAKGEAEYAENKGQRYTLENLSELTGISTDTLTKVLGGESRVDKQTLKACFQAFGLTLQTTDYYSPDQQLRLSIPDPQPNIPALPGGQLPLQAATYIPRPTAEAESYQAIERPGALIRIQGSHRTGKTSLMARIAHQASTRGYQPVFIRFQLAERSVLQDLDRLLRWFCASVGLEMGLDPTLDTYWDGLFGSKLSSKIYFEQYLLPAAQRPVVLLLDDVDRLFRYPEVADEFFGLLRTWYEEAKTVHIWQLLRIVLTQTSEVYIPLNINKSPFNVGVGISLPPLSVDQVQALGQTYGLSWSRDDARRLLQLVGGQPYLVHVMAHYIWKQEVSLAQVLAAPLECGIFTSYLQHLLRKLQQSETLRQSLEQILIGEALPSETSGDLYRLQSMGLVNLKGSPQISCELFQTYFGTQLGKHEADHVA